jgi:hypothetical protein
MNGNYLRFFLKIAIKHGTLYQHRRCKMIYEKLEKEILVDQEILEAALMHLWTEDFRIPKKLIHLTEMQWLILSQLLEELLQQQEESTLH